MSINVDGGLFLLAIFCGQEATENLLWKTKRKKCIPWLEDHHLIRTRDVTWQGELVLLLLFKSPHTYLRADPSHCFNLNMGRFFFWTFSTWVMAQMPCMSEKPFYMKVAIKLHQGGCCPACRITNLGTFLDITWFLPESHFFLILVNQESDYLEGVPPCTCFSHLILPSQSLSFQVFNHRDDPIHNSVPAPELFKSFT